MAPLLQQIANILARLNDTTAQVRDGSAKILTRIEQNHANEQDPATRQQDAATATGQGQTADHSLSGMQTCPAELLFELISQRYECGSTLITGNLPFEEWTETFGSEHLTGALLDRLTHQVNILKRNGESCRLNQSRSRHGKANK